MSRLQLVVIGVVLTITAAPACAAPPTDVADLFPPDTLAYAELHNPAELGPQLAALVKGTPLEDSIPFIHAKKGEAKTLQELKGKQELAALALLASPEMMGEFRRLGGVALGLVGYNAQGNPEIVFAVLTGESATAGLAARAFLTMSTNLRKVGEVSKVPVFQTRPPVLKYNPNGQPEIDHEKQPTEGMHEPTFAYTPGLFLIGSSKNAIGTVLKRFLGEEKTHLRGTDEFKTAAAAYRQTGLFFYINVPQFIAKTDEAGRLRGAMFDFDIYSWVKLTANHKALKSISGCVRFRDGGLSLTVNGWFDPAQKSPLMDFFAGSGVKVELLHHARKPASFAASVNLPEKNRGAALMGFLDSLAKANGALGRLPSDVVKDLEDKHKVPLTTGVLTKVKSITVISPTRQELPKGATLMPVIVLHMEDAPSATTLEEFLPKLIGELAGEKPPQPSSEMVDRVKVFTLAGTGLPWKAAVHYVRKDAVLAIGLDRKHVAAAVTPDAAASVASGDKGIIGPAGDPVALLGTLSIGDLLVSLTDEPRPEGPVRPIAPGRPLPGGGIGLPPEKLRDEEEKARKAFLAAFRELPPTVVTVRRSGDELRIELFQPKVQGGGMTPIINAGVTWFDKLVNFRDPNRNLLDFYDGPIKGRW
ncbi:MAG: hypothetical protein L0241_30315 [Planctomycetia bacterium]|nr:hypothetical protein [Planctomycetia bacterium]